MWCVEIRVVLDRRTSMGPFRSNIHSSKIIIQHFNRSTFQLCIGSSTTSQLNSTLNQNWIIWHLWVRFKSLLSSLISPILMSPASYLHRKFTDIFLLTQPQFSSTLETMSIWILYSSWSELLRWTPSVNSPWCELFFYVNPPPSVNSASACELLLRLWTPPPSANSSSVCELLLRLWTPPPPVNSSCCISCDHVSLCNQSCFLIKQLSIGCARWRMLIFEIWCRMTSWHLKLKQNLF